MSNNNNTRPFTSTYLTVSVGAGDTFNLPHRKTPAVQYVEGKNGGSLIRVQLCDNAHMYVDLPTARSLATTLLAILWTVPQNTDKCDECDRNLELVTE